MPEVLSCEDMVRANAPSALAVTKYQLYLIGTDIASSVHFSEQRINTMSRSRDYKKACSLPRG